MTHGAGAARVADEPALGGPGRVVASRWRPNATDALVAANLALFVVTCVFAYHRRWTTYAGEGRFSEFALYTALLLAGIAVAWALLRRIALPAWLLALVQTVLLAHFAGALVHFDGVRLYGHDLLGLRYDKYVHVAGTFVGAIALQEGCRMAGLPVARGTRVVSCLALLGIGSCIELAQYAVTSTVPRHSVEPYADTMGDLLANVVGGVLYLAFGAALADRLERRSARATAVASRGVQA